MNTMDTTPLNVASALRIKLAISILFFTIALIAGCAGTKNSPHDGQGQVTEPLLPVAIAQEQIKPGLSVRYYDDFFSRHLDSLPSKTDPFKSGRIGKPIRVLDREFGRTEVFDSGTNRGIGMRMEGLLHLTSPGTYQFQALSNDGIRVYVNGQRILDDPDVHSNRLTPVAPVNITTPGWYPLKVEYFQRKGTAAIMLYWQPPGSNALSIIPAQAYGHIP